MNTKINILSLQSDMLGNRVYSLLLRDYFSQSTQCNLESLWFHEERGLYGRLIHKLLAWKIPNLHRRNLDFRRARAEWVYGYIGQRLAQRKSREKRYDLLHFHTQVPAFGSYALMKQIPTVISTDMTAYQASRENPRFAWTFRPNVIMEKRIFDAASHLVVFSQWAKHSAVTEHYLDERKVSVIPPGVPLDKIRLVDPSDKPGIPKILFVGGDFIRKGGEDLVAVFLNRFADRAELHLVTDHPVAARHPNLFVHAGVQAYSPQWHKLFQYAYCFVMPTYAEAFGSVFLEALSFGLPVIATRINAIPEIIEDGVSGLLIEPGDRQMLAERIAQLLDDPQASGSMGRNARRRAEQRFDAEKNFAALEAIYIRTAENGRSSQPRCRAL